MTFTLVEIGAFLAAVVVMLIVFDFVREAGFKAGTAHGDIKSLSKSFDDFETNFKDDVLTAIKGHLFDIHWQPPTTHTNSLRHASSPGDTISPRCLSDLGTEVSRNLDAGNFVKILAPGLEPRSRGLAEYDIQKLCFEYINNEFQPTPAMEARLKKCAYDNGIGLQDVLAVLVIELRDELLRKFHLVEG